MGLLDYDDWEILKQAGILKGGRKLMRHHAVKEDEIRFAELQNLGHKENSADFSDSPFADRVEVEQCAKCGGTLKANGVEIATCECV